MLQKNELKLRVNGARDIYPNQDIDVQLEELRRLREKYHTGLIKATTAKYFADGVIEGLTGFLLEPYKEAAGKGENYYGKFVWNTAEMQDAFKKTLDMGFQIHVHSIGDAATKNVINAMEFAQNNPPENKYRNVITHLQLVSNMDITRMSKLGIIANVQPYWHFKDPISWFDAEQPFLGDRAENEYPLKSFLDAGVLVTASSDHPVTSNPNPFCAIQAAVTRNLINAEKYGLTKITDIDNPTWLLNKDERVTAFDVVKAFTINAAYSLFMDKEVGSIEVGKYADIIVIDRDLFQTDPLEIESIKVIKTIFNGEIVYESE
jgi:predicted amidohydrolase YtcJ